MVNRGPHSFCPKMLWRGEIVVEKLEFSWFLTFLILPSCLFSALWPNGFLINLFCPLYRQPSSWFTSPMNLSLSPCSLTLPLRFHLAQESSQNKQKVNEDCQPTSAWTGGGLGGSKAWSKREKKKSVLLSPYRCASQKVGTVMSVSIYLRNQLCVNGVSRLTSGFSTVNKNNLHQRLQAGSNEKRMWVYFRKCWGQGSHFIYLQYLLIFIYGRVVEDILVCVFSSWNPTSKTGFDALKRNVVNIISLPSLRSQWLVRGVINGDKEAHVRRARFHLPCKSPMASSFLGWRPSVAEPVMVTKAVSSKSHRSL